MVSRVPVAAVLLGLALPGGAVVGAAPATAGTAGTLPPCNLTVPRYVAVTQRGQIVRGSVNQACLDLWDRSTGQMMIWDLVGLTSAAPKDISMAWDFYMRHEVVDTWPAAQMGQFRWQPRSAWVILDGVERTLTQNAPTMDVRLGSSLRGSVSRSGGNTTIGAAATYFSSTYNRWVPWSSKQVLIYGQKPGASTWTYLGAATTNVAGKASLRKVLPGGLRYRVVAPAAAVIWNSQVIAGTV